MLKELRITNYALIEELGLRPDAALNTITGETGAGKSILLGALGLILGQRADLTVLRDPEKKCVVEADFDLTALQLGEFFGEHDLDYEDVRILRREIIPSGKSRAFINDTPVKLPVLRALSEFLIDIHGQNQTHWLNDGGFQLDLIDGIAKNKELRKAYQSAYAAWSDLSRSIAKWKEEQSEQQAELDYHQFLLNELEEAELVDGEIDELESEAKTLEHAEEIQSALSNGLQLLDEAEGGIINLIKELRNILSSLSRWGSRYEDWSQRVESQVIELDDLSFEISRAVSEVEVNPNRLDAVNARLDLLNGLMQKHRAEGTEALIERRNELRQQVGDTHSLSDKIEEASIELKSLAEEVKKQGAALSESRREAHKPLIAEMSQLLSRLGMPDAKFDLHWIEQQEAGPRGLEAVEFLFSANKGREVEPLKKVASGGELSRFMLGIKNLIARYRQLPTILFDEIDTGVSGEMAGRMGALMAEMGERMQVICITHLPQVAAKGVKHFKVFKETTDCDTYTGIRALDKLERVEEIASMLSGASQSDAARQTAKELLARKVVR